MVIKFWKNPPNKKPRPIQWQIAEMKRCFPSFAVINKSTHFVIWQGILQPDSSMNSYTIELEYKRGERPKVFVINPKLEDLPEKPIPHLYSKNALNKDRNLCLYFPANNEFTQQDSIAHTIVPWTSHWLFCYEIWRLTGEWVGGGKHPLKGK